MGWTGRGALTTARSRAPWARATSRARASTRCALAEGSQSLYTVAEVALQSSLDGSQPVSRKQDQKEVDVFNTAVEAAFAYDETASRKDGDKVSAVIRGCFLERVSFNEIYHTI